MIPYDDKLSYELFDDGYDIYTTVDGRTRQLLTQRDPYGKLFIPDGTYEENAIAHCKSMSDIPKPDPTPEEKARADLDFLALMMDIDLPSQEGE